MSNFDFDNLHLTYLIPYDSNIGYHFQNEKLDYIRHIINSVDIEFKIASTNYVKDFKANEDTANTIKFVGFYCVFIFESEEDMTQFKLTFPSGESIVNGMEIANRP